MRPTVPMTALATRPAAERTPASIMKAPMKAAVVTGKPSAGVSAAYRTMSATAVASITGEMGSRSVSVRAGPRHSWTALAAQASPRPRRASRGQKPGPRLPSRATSSSERVAGYSAAARITPSSGATARRSDILLAQSELFDEAIEDVDLAGDPARELLRALVAVGSEVPLLGEFLPLRRVHCLLDGVGDHRDALGRRAFLGHDAAELRQRDL